MTPSLASDASATRSMSRASPISAVAPDGPDLGGLGRIADEGGDRVAFVDEVSQNG